MSYDTVDAINLLRSYSRHRDFVRLALVRVQHALAERAIAHDASKLTDDEFAGFSRINQAARVNKFGSPEYAEGMRRERGVIDLHFSRNTHHPEWPSYQGDEGDRPEISFLDVIEMVCDWWGARKGYDDPRSWADSVKLNLETKGKFLTPEQRWLAEQVAAFLGGEA